ncbi:MAG: LAGLIDADG family homing endonuclease [Candidatus Methanomethylicaceae archaeon]
MSVVSMSISKRGERRRYLPLEIRLQMYNDVIKLRKQGLIYKEIQRRIYEKYGEQTSITQISFWINKKHKPFRKINKFDGKPSRELSYIIGVILGDGCKSFTGKNYYLILEAKDKEFPKEFGKCLAKVLNRKEPYKPFWNKHEKRWRVVGFSILLYKFLDKPFEKLKPYIEYSKETVSAFLQAMFDGEGCIHVNKKRYRRELTLHNTNKELLNYVKYLLKKYFDINTTGPHLGEKKGKLRRFPDGRITKSSKDCYYIYVCTRSLLNYYKFIGFRIKRKQKRLIEAIKQ